MDWVKRDGKPVQQAPANKDRIGRQDGLRRPFKLFLYVPHQILCFRTGRMFYDIFFDL